MSVIITDDNGIAREYGMGRLVAQDLRDENYLMSSIVPLENMSPRTRYHRAPAPLNQGSTSQCVSYSLAHALMTTPGYMHEPPYDLRALYDLAQRLDEWAGEGYDGTSVRAGCKALQQMGQIQEYRWITRAEDVVSMVSNIGPCVLGTQWYEGMNRPDSRGVIRPSGRPVGGHAYCVVGYSLPRNAVRILNSWGNEWGENGRAWINFSDLTNLLNNWGEATCLIQQ